jgi:hypothetical protein
MFKTTVLALVLEAGVLHLVLWSDLITLTADDGPASDVNVIRLQ